MSLDAPVFTTPAYDPAFPTNAITTTVVDENGVSELAAVEAICPFFYELKERNFILVAHQHGQNIYTLNNKLVSAIEWSSEGLINTTVEAAAGSASVGHMLDLPDALFAEIGMARPTLMAQGARNIFSPLRNFGTRNSLLTLIRAEGASTLFREQQRQGLAMAKWMIKARKKSIEQGPLCHWRWNQRTLELEIEPIVAQAAVNEREATARLVEVEDGDDDEACEGDDDDEENDDDEEWE
ncbi:hypothetical protein DFP72DRAFT_1058306 [Ephemerocybe angulata]|uniref:Uncharacterized protein n=1 Tax=Ephemerocybe angulata TaxID=980116 RepID=A0A8H6IHV8_9AGAR|nr:hypothetical protein DFP72DRAFT_1058306 [Tulosesus angulatus]